MEIRRKPGRRGVSTGVALGGGFIWLTGASQGPLFKSSGSQSGCGVWWPQAISSASASRHVISVLCEATFTHDTL